MASFRRPVACLALALFCAGGAALCRAAENDAELETHAAVDAAAEEAVESAAPKKPSFAESVFGESLVEERDAEGDHSKFVDPDAAKFDDWEPLADDGLWPAKDKPPLRPFDWMRKFGFHHSSTDGPAQDKSVPLKHWSWLNRPYHFDWFSGPILGSELDGNRIEQQSALFGGLRVGWDFDYYWGVETRFGWANPDINSVYFADLRRSGYFAGDVNLVYYPWGDTRVRPYGLLGLGMVQLDTVLPDAAPAHVTLLSMPIGGGVTFPLTHWAAMRLDLIDNLAFGGDGVDTLNNFSFTAGMEFRLGNRPNNYWPWRASRYSW